MNKRNELCIEVIREFRTCDSLIVAHYLIHIQINARMEGNL